MNGQVRAWMYLNSEAEADDWISMLVQYIAKLNQESPFEGISPVAGTRYQQIEERIPQYALGDAIALNLSTAMEHLSTVGYLLREAHYFPPFSLYTLCRAAFESLAQGMWVLAGTSQNEIITRRLRVHGYNLRRQGEVELLGAEGNARKGRERLERFAQLAGISEADQAKVKNANIRSTEMVATAGQKFNMLRMSSLWKVSSGVAHGLTWGVQAGTDAEEIEGSRHEFGASYRLTGKTDLLCFMLYEAVFGCLLLRDVYRERSQGMQRPVGLIWGGVYQNLETMYHQYLNQKHSSHRTDKR